MFIRCLDDLHTSFVHMIPTFISSSNLLKSVMTGRTNGPLANISDACAFSAHSPGYCGGHEGPDKRLETSRQQVELAATAS